MSRVPPLVLAIVVATACGDPAEPEPSLEVELAFGIERTAEEAPFLARGEDGRVVVRGSFTTPCSPYEARAAAVRSAQGLSLTIIGDNEGDCPLDVVSDYGYEARVSGLRPGAVLLRLAHDWSDVAWPRVMPFDTMVTVR